MQVLHWRAPARLTPPQGQAQIGSGIGAEQVTGPLQRCHKGRANPVRSGSAHHQTTSQYTAVLLACLPGARSPSFNQCSSDGRNLNGAANFCRASRPCLPRQSQMSASRARCAVLVLCTCMSPGFVPADCQSLSLLCQQLVQSCNDRNCCIITLHPAPAGADKISGART